MLENSLEVGSRIMERGGKPGTDIRECGVAFPSFPHQSLTAGLIVDSTEIGERRQL